MKSLKEALIKKHSDYNQRRTRKNTPIEAGDIIQTQAVGTSGEYLVVMTMDQYNKYYDGDLDRSDFSEDTLFIPLSDDGGWANTNLWDDNFKCTDSDFLDPGDIVAIYKTSSDSSTRDLVIKKYRSPKQLKDLIRTKGIKPIEI